MELKKIQILIYTYLLLFTHFYYVYINIISYKIYIVLSIKQSFFIL